MIDFNFFKSLLFGNVDEPANSDNRRAPKETTTTETIANCEALARSIKDDLQAVRGELELLETRIRIADPADEAAPVHRLLAVNEHTLTTTRQRRESLVPEVARHSDDMSHRSAGRTDR